MFDKHSLQHKYARLFNKAVVSYSSGIAHIYSSTSNIFSTQHHLHSSI
jgi:hypothetical protein